MRLKSLTAAITCIATLGAPLFAGAEITIQSRSAAQDAGITLKARSDQTAPMIVVRSIYDFEKAISLKMKTDPALGVPPALIKTISKMGMVDGKGVVITSGFDVDMANDLVVAFSGGTSEIIKSANFPYGIEVIASFKDANGNFISPPKDSLAIYSLTGEKLCFTYKTIRQAPPKMAFALLLDKSFSMNDVFGDVKQTAKDFLRILPKSAICVVGSFDTGYEFTRKTYQSCGKRNFGIDSIAIGGGTDIYLPLKDTYQNFSSPAFNGYQKATIIITDGYTLSDPVRKAELMKLKGDALTFVYFIGGSKKDDLEGITDSFIAQGHDVKQSLSQYFSAIGQAYKSQKVLTAFQCPKGGKP
ncbi:MAG: hypothetical protein ACRBDL_08840 [Alphaproteobacteria bacterium]